MKLMKTLSVSAAAIALVTGFATISIPTTVQAQQTDATIRGIIVDGNNAGVLGATVKIVHTPTGTSDVATTSSNGSFFETGLRVGGPYTLTITAPGFSTETIEGLYLEPGNPKRLTINLAELQEMDTITVIGRAAPKLDLNNGAGSAFDNESITRQPSVSRDIVDTLVRDPLVNRSGNTGSNISIAGVNPKLNALALDGVLQGDDFGLSNSIYATDRSPISLEAIENASVVTSSYDVQSQGFQGGLVNVVTKSGTNEFHGSGYWYRSGQDFLGEVSDGVSVPASEFKEREWGLSLGGPIIKDKLFFFYNYENFNTASPVNFAGSDAANGITDAEAFFSTLNSLIASGTGFDAGGRPGSLSNPETSVRHLGKIDWNINDDHRLEASYQRTRETGSSTSSTSLVSAFYGTPQQLDSYSGGLYSDWTDTFSTEFRIGYKDNTRGQNCNAGPGVGEIQINLSPTDIAANAALAAATDSSALPSNLRIVAGCDRFRHGNTFADDRLQILSAANLVKGDHVITFGAEWEDYGLENLFLSDSLGTFIYDDLTELATGDDVTVNYRNVVTNNTEDAKATWGYSKLSLFVQDEWQVNPRLTVNAGVRYERYLQDDQPPLREDFVAAYGRRNTDNLDGIDIIQPRIGFNYEVADRTTLSGGFGLFSGGNPHVWVSNAFQPQIFSESATLDGVNPTMIPAALTGAIAASDTTTPTFIDIIDPDFDIPSQWKGSLRLNHAFDMNFGGINLGEDYQLTLQYIFSKTKNDILWENLAYEELGLDVGVAPDGRPIYPNLGVLDVDNAVQLTNAKGGRSHIVSAALSKRFESGFDFDVSYAFQEVNSVTPGTSSRGISNYRSFFTFDRQNPEVGNAPFETRHAFNVNLGYENDFIGDLVTRVDLFASFSSGEPYSYTYDAFGCTSNCLFGSPGNGEEPYGNDLLYVPTVSGGASTDPLVVFASGFDGAAFENYLNENDIVQGQIAPKNSDRSNWNQLFNFRLEQDLPFVDFGPEGQKLKMVLDIFNVANLINDKWGTQFNGQAFDNAALVRAELVEASDVATNGVDGATALTGNEPATVCQAQGDCLYRYTSFRTRDSSFVDLADSVYKMRIGIRYEF